MFKRFDVQKVQNVFPKDDAQPFEHLELLNLLNKKTTVIAYAFL